MNDIFSLKDFKMPDGFIWGSGYAGHQVEGNNVHSQWWDWEINGKTKDKSGLACNSYAMYKDDIDLAVSLGHQIFRTSVEWSRIEPEEGHFDEKELDHYVRLFAYAKEKGIKTFCTLVHCAHPLWFEKIGHFTTYDNAKYFERYVRYVVPKLSPYIDMWNVLNEINLNFATSVERGNYCFHSVRYHAFGYRIIKEYSSAPVSSSHALIEYAPYRPNSEADRAMCAFCDFRDNGLFFDAIRTGEIAYPFRDAVYDPNVKGAADFWSLNSYYRFLVDARKKDAMRNSYYDVTKINGAPCITPEIMITSYDRLRDKPIYVTENGINTDDDNMRIAFYAEFFSAMREAIDMGIDIRGYVTWSLLDNFEWGSFEPHYGICSVNRESGNFERIPKKSAYFLRDIYNNNGFSQQILRKYLSAPPSVINRESNDKTGAGEVNVYG